MRSCPAFLNDTLASKIGRYLVFFWLILVMVMVFRGETAGPPH